jgi:large subunit ribosomal protein L21
MYCWGSYQGLHRRESSKSGNWWDRKTPRITGQHGGSLLDYIFPPDPVWEPEMYAVFEDGSRQYRVAEGDSVVVDYRDVEKGTRVEFNRVLLYRNGDDTRIGQPLLDGLRVLAEVVDHPSTKHLMMKYRRRKNSRRTKGHRQWYTKVQVKHILLPGVEPPAPPPPSQTAAGSSTSPAAPQTPSPQSPAAPTS